LTGGLILQANRSGIDILSAHKPIENVYNDEIGPGLELVEVQGYGRLQERMRSARQRGQQIRANPQGGLLQSRYFSTTSLMIGRK
jgi:hypothetical protein